MKENKKVYLLVIDDTKYGPSYEVYATDALAEKRLEYLIRKYYAERADAKESEIKEAVEEGVWDDGNNTLTIKCMDVITE